MTAGSGGDNFQFAPGIMLSVRENRN
jgi:hypothetical protein